MVTTRGGSDTSSNVYSSPASLRKRRAEPNGTEPELTKRKKVDQADEDKNESPPVLEQIVVRPHPAAAPPPTGMEAADATTQPTLPVRNHIRFGSASPPPVLETTTAALVTQSAVDNVADEESDDDAAPETISLSTAQAQTRAVQEQAEQIVKEISETAKRRRRRRDAQLKAQAAGSTKRKFKEAKNGADKQAAVAEEAADEDESPAVAEMKPTKPSYSLDNIPALLPDELLATEAPVRLPTPPQSSKPSQIKDKKTPEAFAALKIPRESAPKDLTYDNLKVRVLTQNNPLLPPPASGRSKDVREAWLKGRPSFEKMTKRGKGAGKLQRREIRAGKAFV
jgi:hypothetical protein